MPLLALQAPTYESIDTQYATRTLIFQIPHLHTHTYAEQERERESDKKETFNWFQSIDIVEFYLDFLDDDDNDKSRSELR